MPRNWPSWSPPGSPSALSIDRARRCLPLLPGLMLALLCGLAPDPSEGRERARTRPKPAAAAEKPVSAPLPPQRPSALRPPPLRPATARPAIVPPARADQAVKPVARAAAASEPARAGDAAGSPADPAGPFPMGSPASLPSACLADFAESGAEILPNPADTGSGDCEVEEPVTFRAIRTADGTVTLDNAVTLRCGFALEVVRWVREDLVAIAATDGRKLSKLVSTGGHACRGRNRVAGAKLSEHATGNALDLGQLLMQDGRAVPLYDREPATRALRESVRRSACARFTTVLGPGADASHQDHLHVDLRQRGGGYKMCQWTVE